MLELPEPPPSLPEAPLAFYARLRAAVARTRPALVDAAAVEVDFGDGGVAVTLPHAAEPAWTLAAQVSRRAAVVFAGPLTAHFDASAGGDWTAPAAALLERALSGGLEVEVAYRGDDVVRVGGERVWSLGALARWRPARMETVRLDFGARSR